MFNFQLWWESPIWSQVFSFKIEREKSRAEQMTHWRKICPSAYTWGVGPLHLSWNLRIRDWNGLNSSGAGAILMISTWTPWMSSRKSVTWFHAINAFSPSFTHKNKRAAVEANFLLYSNQSTFNYFSANYITMKDLRCARWDPLVHMNTFGIWD